MSVDFFDLARTPIENGTTLIEASAGTGKTYCLTGLVLRLLLERRVASVAEILVMTFTNAATAELVERTREMLRKAIDVFAGRAAEPDEFLGALHEAHAGGGLQILETALRDLDDIEICTIHGFCRRMLSQNAFETGTAFDVEYVESDEPLLTRAAEDFWRRELYGRSNLVTAVIAHAKWTPATFTSAYRTTRTHPDVAIEPRPASLDDAVASLDAAARALCKAWDGPAVRAFLANADFAKGKEWSDGERDARLSALEDFCCGARPAAVGIVLDMCSAKLEKRLKGDSKKAIPSFAFSKACDALARTVDELAIALRAAFIRDVGRMLDDEKRRSKAAGYDDLLHGVHAALADPERRAFLKRIVGRQFRAVLIDEFQDTDTIQYRIFRELFDGIPLFLIGDPKQAIYGFRGADVFAYLRAQSDADRGYTMDRNYRSETALVTGVNALFSSAARPFVFDGIDFVGVEPSGSADEEPLRADGLAAIEWRWLPATRNKGEGNENACAVVKAEILRLLSGAARIGDRAVEPRDIAVLTRTNDQARMVQKTLADAGVPAVISRADNVLDSDEARELHRLLRAVAEPRNESAVRAALATRAWGVDAARLFVLQDDERGWQTLVEQLEALRETWARKGFIVMAQALLHASDARRRLLALPGGARRLTNLLHLVELTHRAAAEHHLSPEAVVTWLGHAHRNPDPYLGETTELRLETDADAVQISTIHQSKGLEYEIVFCPFLWEASRDGTDEAFLVHVGDHVVYDCSNGADPGRVTARIAERLSEDLRLAYVALTRAKRRNYVAWGEIGTDASGRSSLAYLLHQPSRAERNAAARTRAEAEWAVAALAHAQGNAAHWREELERLCRAHPGEMALRDSPAEPLDSRLGTATARERLQLAERTFPRRAEPRLVPWRVASFSSFRMTAPAEAGAPRESTRRGRRSAPLALATSRESTALELPDHVDPPLAAPDERATGGMFAFARGPRAGTCLHEIFERCDFAEVGDAATDGLVADALRRHSLDRPAMHDAAIEPARTVVQMLGDVTASELPGAGFALRSVARDARLNEWQFYLPMAKVSQRKLADCFERHGRTPALESYPALLRTLGEREVEGFLMGFVDLVFTHADRWYVVDWKSNHLGNRGADYGPASIVRAMREHHYVLQYHLYTVALHRYLATRLPRYDYDRDFGGVYYAFIRAIREGDAAGWYADRPARELVEALDALIGASS